MITLSIDQVNRLHSKIIDTTGGTKGLRDKALLESALSAAFQTFDGVELYASTTAKIARTAYGLVCNHPYIDGNKRIGTYVMLALLELNQLEVNFTDDDIIRIGLRLANGEMNDTQLRKEILKHSK